MNIYTYTDCWYVQFWGIHTFLKHIHGFKSPWPLVQILSLNCPHQMLVISANFWHKYQNRKNKTNVHIFCDNEWLEGIYNLSLRGTNKRPSSHKSFSLHNYLPVFIFPTSSRTLPRQWEPWTSLSTSVLSVPLCSKIFHKTSLSREQFECFSCCYCFVLFLRPCNIMVKSL